MSLYAFHLAQIISTVLGQVDHMAVKMVTLPEPESGTKRPKPTLLPWCYLPNHNRFGYCEVLIWFRDGTIRGGHWEV